MSEHELWNELGNLYFLSGTYNQAAYAYHRSIQLDNSFGRPYCNLALTYVKQGRFAEAVELYQRSIELLVDDKEKAITWYRLGDVYRHLKDYRDAIMAYQQADLLDTEMSQESKETGQVLYGGSGDGIPAKILDSTVTSPEVQLELDRASAPQPEVMEPPEASDPSVTVTEIPSIDEGEQSPSAAAAPLDDETPAELLSDLTVMPQVIDTVQPSEIEVHPENVEPRLETLSELVRPDPGWIDEGQIFSRFEHETEVYIPDYTDEQLDQWLPIDPDSVTEQAEPDISRLYEDHLQLAPEPAPIKPERRQFEQQTVALTLEKRPEQIPMPPVSELELDIPQDFPDVFIVPGVDQVQAVRIEAPQTPPEPVESIEDLAEIESEISKFRHVVQQNPRNASAWDTLGTLYKSARKYRDAILAYQQAVAMDPAKAPYHHHLGIIYAIEGREEDAMKAFQEVIELDPNHSLANATLGGYYRKMGFEELAQRHIGKAMKNFYNSENEYNRACLEALCGNIEQSIELLRIALQNKQTYVDWVLRDPDLDSIRRDPRFKQLISDYTA